MLLDTSCPTATIFIANYALSYFFWSYYERYSWNKEQQEKRPDNKSVTEFVQKNHSTNVDFNFIEKTIEKLIKNKKTVSKLTIQDMTSYFPIPNDQLNENKVTESEPISSGISTSPPSNISAHQTSSNCQPLFRCNDFFKNEVFNTFYEDYVEFKHYVNDIVKLVTLITGLSDENSFEKMKIKSLEGEIKSLRMTILLWEKTFWPNLKL